jgi:hypothetical protein
MACSMALESDVILIVELVCVFDEAHLVARPATGSRPANMRLAGALAALSSVASAFQSHVEGREVCWSARASPADHTEEKDLNATLQMKKILKRRF